LAGRNLLALAAVLLLGIIATAAVYHRFWEKFTPFEPSHGPARWSLSAPPSLSVDWMAEEVRLPDGSAWFAPSANLASAKLDPLGTMLANFHLLPVKGQWAAGTNWSDLQGSQWDMAGLKRDGTLWLLQGPVGWEVRSYSMLRSPAYRQGWMVEHAGASAKYSLVQFGQETNWSSFVLRGSFALLVKNDGTLWRLGVADWGGKHQKWPGLRAFAPKRLGTESNWAAVFRRGFWTDFRKADGSSWLTGDWFTNEQPRIEIEPGLVVHRVPSLDRNQIPSPDEFSHGLQFMAGIRKDGTFRVWAEQRAGPHLVWQWSPTDWQIGAGTNWLAVAGCRDQAVTLKDDGTLWLWNFHRRPFARWQTDLFKQEIQATKPVRLGTHSDWLALSGGQDGGVTALAADGSLWYWPLADAQSMASLAALDSNPSGQSWLPLLDVSRKPQFVGNVFSEAKSPGGS
jgi:hypothetical protein